MQIIREYTIQLQIYHDAIIGRLQFKNPTNGAIEESSLYSLSELENLTALWKCDSLLGSFGIGTQLHQNAEFRIVQK